MEEIRDSLEDKIKEGDDTVYINVWETGLWKPDVSPVDGSIKWSSEDVGVYFSDSYDILLYATPYWDGSDGIPVELEVRYQDTVVQDEQVVINRKPECIDEYIDIMENFIDSIKPSIIIDTDELLSPVDMHATEDTGHSLYD